MSLNIILYRSVIFSLPVFLIAIINYIFSVQFYSFDNDATASYYGMGLSWINGIYPKLYFHQPAYFFQEITALLVILSDYNKINLVTFNNLGIITNLIFISISAIWISYVSIKMKVSTLSIFFIGFILASFPTTLLCMSIWTFNIPIIYSLAPIALTYYLLLEKRKLSLNVYNLFYLGIGFVIANYFLGLIILIVVILDKLLKVVFIENSFSIKKIISSKSKMFLYLKILLPILIISTGWLIHYYFEFKDPFYRHIYIFLLGIILFIYFIYLFRLKKLISHNPVALLLTGWSVGVNFFAIPWFYSLYVSFFSVGGTSQNLNINNFVNFIQFFHLNVWHYLILITLIILLSNIVLRKDNKNNFTSILLLTVIVLNIVLTLSVILNFTDNNESYYRIGLSSRYFIISIIPILCIVLLMQNYNLYMKILLSAIVFIISSASISYYVKNLPGHIKKVDDSIVKLQKSIDRLEAKKAHIIFLESYYPIEAAELYAINKNVSSRSKNFNKSIHEKQNYYMNEFDILKMKKVNNNYFIHHSNLGNSFKIIEKFDYINIFISKYEQ